MNAWCRLSCLLFSLGLFGCDGAAGPDPDPVYETAFIAPSTQRTGTPEAGFAYLVGGDYVGRGIPLDVFADLAPLLGGTPGNVLNRTGDAATLPPDFNAVTAPNGVRMAAPNCLTCHAQTLNGRYVVGLGNSVANFTRNTAALVPALDAAIRARHGEDGPAWAAYLPFREATLATAPHIQTQVRGMNPADRLTFVLAAHRDPETMAWSNTPLFPLPEPDVPTDVPAWWLLKKKHAMFYTGLGQGDFARISMTASLLTLRDTTEARRIDDRFPDVLAYIFSLEPPPYPEAIDAALAAEGEMVFEETCSTCHGRYGADPVYPNVRVALGTIGTDPALAESYGANQAYVDRYNMQSWFGQAAPAGKLVPALGYVAPPLDGIWATAPYLHNGAVPTLADLLDSPQRPNTWQRTFDTADYDYAKLGWRYTRPAADPGNPEVYDTALPGHGNQGHTFGDDLTPQQRTAVLEYLKTL